MWFIIFCIYCFGRIFSWFVVFFFFFKQKTAYEMRISDWSSDVCSSDLHEPAASLDRRLEAADRGLALVQHLARRHRAGGDAEDVFVERIPRFGNRHVLFQAVRALDIDVVGAVPRGIRVPGDLASRRPRVAGSASDPWRDTDQLTPPR